MYFTSDDLFFAGHLPFAWSNPQGKYSRGATGQKQATVRSSVLEVLLEITKFCDLYLMERVLDDESEVRPNSAVYNDSSVHTVVNMLMQKALAALENAGVFTSGGLVKDKVLFCSTENGRSSFVRQLEPDWHIDTNPEIVSQLAVNLQC
ncbi:hypothetical protein GH714_015511 [Hevea brasiliensis]|uniref:Uncharacterized protein n=1 Tax=Hevea brasiliensis TaxID=3981 RepID=A0A6A6KT59_HEVBR|nr:hypothetical protein GH714_015511 [Hevea brasiliensis]